MTAGGRPEHYESRLIPSCHIGGPLDDTNDVVAFREECHPIIECGLLLLVQVLPVRADILSLGRGLAQSS